MILIDENLKKAVPDAALGVVLCSAKVEASSAAQNDDFDALTADVAARYGETPNIAAAPHIKATREAYKALGKDPARYRNSAEAMLRRVVKGVGLYRVNNAVDVNNMLSIDSGYSLGSYDMAAIRGDIVWKRAPDGESYKGIGKDVLNIEHLPALYDDDGVFGNPTSDSRRTMIETGEGRKKLLYVIYSFNGTDDLPMWTEKLCGLLKTYCGADIDLCFTVK